MASLGRSAKLNGQAHPSLLNAVANNSGGPISMIKSRISWPSESTFLYRCPTTGHKVQGLLRRNVCSTDDAVTYETVTCLACNGVHLVDPGSGRVLGVERAFAASGRSTQGAKVFGDESPIPNHDSDVA
jgi:hypothetical protein